MKSKFTCIVCQSPVTVTDEIEYSQDGPPFVSTVVTHVHHVDPMDAACRLVFEVFSDEVERVTSRMVDRMRENLGLKP